MPKKKLWLTYAWKDNAQGSFDYVVQELDTAGLDVRFDRRSLVPGQRLWEQIGSAICHPGKCEAFGILATASSLASEACVEELSYALDRALSEREKGFPVFALFHGVSARDLPPSLRVRLCVSLEADGWVDRVLAAVEGRAPSLRTEGLDPWLIKEWSEPDRFVLEIRPRFERIRPFSVAVDLAAKKRGDVFKCRPGPAGRVPTRSVALNRDEGEGLLPDGTPVYYWQGDDEASPTSSYYLYCRQRLSRVWAGPPDGLKELRLG